MAGKAGRKPGSKTGKPRASMEDIEAMPALLTTEDVGRITGWTPTYIAQMCKYGALADLAVKVGRSYLLSKPKVLHYLGLD